MQNDNRPAERRPIDAKLSKHFTVSEFEYSRTAADNAIVNSMTLPELHNARRLCLTVLEPLRAYVKTPIVISSGFRSKSLNKLVSGAASSLHLRGCAADIVVKNYRPAELARIIDDLVLPFEELVIESGRLHVAVPRWADIMPNYELWTWENITNDDGSVATITTKGIHDEAERS